MPRATMTTKGQITIPKDVRDRLHLNPGDKLDFIVREGGEVVLRPASVDVRDLEGILRRPGTKPVSVEDMRKAIVRRATGGR